MEKPKVLVITGYGINSDIELAHIFTMAGAEAERVHINDLISGARNMEEFDILSFPGGFSFGDHIASGKVYANKIKVYLKDQLFAAKKRGVPMIGICNGFQVLVKLGLLPGAEDTFDQTCSLIHNDSAKFEDRWCYLKGNTSSKSIWTQGIEDIYLPIRHGEGKFVTKDDATLQKLHDNGNISFQYCTKEGGAPEYPDNPNGSVDDIAGICDDSGLIFGLMPHPEVFMHMTNHPRWHREGLRGEGDGVKIFRNAVEYVKSRK
ncbi:MAG: phosphoribosylformylglycinamidine synthase I [Fibrobacterales bacterium]